MAEKKEAVRTLWIEFRGRLEKIQQDMNGVQKVIQGTEKKITGFAKGIEKTLQAALVVAGAVAIKKFGDALVNLAKAGEQAGSIRENFEKLGGSASQIDKATKATLGLVDSFDLMKIANEGMAARIPDFNKNFSQVADLGARLADTLGIDTAQGIQRVTDALKAGKEQALEQIGISIDAEKAYTDYAAAIGVAEKELTKAHKIIAIQTQANERLSDSINRLAPVTDSVANAHDALGVSIGEAYKEIGIGINQSEGLQEAFRSLAETISKIDWEAVGTKVGKLIDLFVRLTDAVLQTGAAFLDAFDTRSGAQKHFDATIENMEAFDRSLKKIEESARKIQTQQDLKKFREENADAFEKLTKSFFEGGDALNGFAERMGSVSQAMTGLVIGLPKGTEKVEDLRDSFKGGKTDAEKLAEEIERLQKSFEKDLFSMRGDEIENALGKAIESIDQSSFQGLKEDLYKHVYEGALEGLQEAVSKGAVSSEAAHEFARKQAEMAASEQQEKMNEAIADNAKEIEEKFKDAYDDSVEYYKDIFRDALDGSSQSAKEMLDDFLVGFASSLAAALTGGIANGLKGSEGLGETLAQLITGAIGQSSGGGGGFSGILDSVFGMGAQAYGGSGYGTNTGGFYGPGGDPSGSGMGQAPTSGMGSGGYVAAGIQAIIGAISAGDIDKATGTAQGTGGAVGTVVGGGIGAIFGPGGAAIGAQAGNMIGSLIGSLFGSGPQNPETQARHAFANWLEEQFNALDTVSFFGPGGQQTTSRTPFNFVEGGSDRFNDPNWVANMDSWGDKAKTTFLGLGEALEEFLELEEDVGSQMGFLLGENFSANVDNARLLVYQLGLDLETLTENLVTAGLSGEMSWHEVEVAIQGVTEAFKPGIEAVGDIKGAVDELTASGGRGAAAIKAVKDIAVEAMEAGAQTIGDLPEFMAAQGISEETINAIMGAIEQRGIQTLEALAEVSDRVGGGIVADIESSSATMANTWAEMTAQLDEVSSKLEALPKDIETNYTINVTANVSDTAQAAIDAASGGGHTIDIPGQSFARGGIVSSRRTFGLGSVMGEAGMEAIMPIRTMANGRLGVDASGMGGGQAGTVINVDARGAGPGVENSVRRALEQVTGRLVGASISSMREARGRSSKYSDY